MWAYPLKFQTPPYSTTATLCSTALHLVPSTSCSGYRTMPRGSFIKRQDDHTHTRCWRNCIGCRWSSASPTSWPCWRIRYGIRQHRRISVGTSEHAVALGHCGHRPFRFSMCLSDELISENDPSAVQRLQLGTLCLLLSSTVTLSLYLSLG